MWNESLGDDLDLDLDYPSLEVVERPIQYALVTIFSLTAALSLTGNITVILVLSLGHRSSSELKSFLINLAVSDVAMAIFSIPFTYTMFLLGRWVFEPWFCPVVMTMQHTSVLVSVYTLTAIGIDRYKAITNPLGRRATASRNGLVISIIWVFSFFISSFQFRISWATSFFYDKQYYYKCQEHWDSEEESQYYTLFVFIITFFIPLLTLTYTYSAVAYKLWRTSAPGNADPARDNAQLRAKWKVTKMLVTIVVLFSVCWLPLQTFMLLFYFIPGFGKFYTDTQRRIYALSYFGCLWLANANSFVNPLVYSFMSENFRSDVKDLFKKIAGCSMKEENMPARSLTRTTVCQESVRSSRYTKKVSSENNIELVDHKIGGQLVDHKIGGQLVDHKIGGQLVDHKIGGQFV